MTLNPSFQMQLLSEADTLWVAQQFAQLVAKSPLCESGLMVYLEGDLGAGKSFFCRALIQTFLPKQRVKSPTYTLIECYESPFATLLHFDLYRLCDAEELEFLGIRELLTPPYLALVEWPSKGRGSLPDADIRLQFEVLPQGRYLTLDCLNDRAETFVNNLTKQIGTKLDKNPT